MQLKCLIILSLTTLATADIFNSISAAFTSANSAGSSLLSSLSADASSLHSSLSSEYTAFTATANSPFSSITASLVSKASSIESSISTRVSGAVVLATGTGTSVSTGGATSQTGAIGVALFGGAAVFAANL